MLGQLSKNILIRAFLSPIFLSNDTEGEMATQMSRWERANGEDLPANGRREFVEGKGSPIAAMEDRKTIFLGGCHLLNYCQT